MAQTQLQLSDIPCLRSRLNTGIESSFFCLVCYSQGTRRLVDWKPNEKRKVSSGTLTPRHAGPSPTREPSGGQKENCDPRVSKKSPLPVLVNKPEEGPVRNPSQTPATGVAKPVPRPPTQQAPCTAEIKTIGACPPLMRAVSWDTVGTLNARNGAPSFSPKAEETFSFTDKPREGPHKSSGYKDFPAQPVNVQKLSKLREVRWRPVFRQGQRAARPFAFWSQCLRDICFASFCWQNTRGNVVFSSFTTINYQSMKDVQAKFIVSKALFCLYPVYRNIS